MPAAAEKQLYVRMSLIDADIVKKALTDLGTEGQHALQQIEQATAPASTGLKAINVISADFQSRVKELSDQTGTFGKVLSSFGPLGSLAAAGVGAFAAAFAVDKISGFVKQSIDAAEQIGIIGERFGISTESMSAFNYIATITGTNIDVFAGGIRTMEKNILAATEGTGKAGVVFDSLGLDLTKLKDLAPEQQFIAIADKVSQLGSSAERTGALVTIFGRSGAELAPAMKNGAEGIQAMVDKAKSLGLIVSDDEYQKIKRYEEAWKTTTLVMQSLARDGFLAAYEAVVKLNDGYNLFFNNINKVSIDGLKAKIEELNKEISSGFVVPADPLTLSRVGAVPIDDAQLEGKKQLLSELQAQLDKLQGAADNAKKSTIDLVAAMDAQKLADFKDKLAAEIDQLQKLDAANKVSESGYTALKDQIDAENKARQGGVDIGTAEGKQLVEQELLRNRLTSSIQATTDARKAENDLRQKLQDMLDTRIRDTQGLTSNLDKNDSEVEQLLTKNIDAYKALSDEGQNIVDKIKEQNTLYAEQKLHVEDVKKVAEEFAKAADGVKTSLSSAFDQVLQKGKITWSSLGTSLVDTIRKSAADAAAALVFNPIIAPVFVSAATALAGQDVGNATAQKLGIASSNNLSSLSSLSNIGSGLWNGTSGGFSSFNSFGFNNLGTGLPGLAGDLSGATLTSILGAGGLGALAGGLLNNIYGGNSTGSTIGGGIGAAAGYAFGGPLGGILGSTAGSFIGSLFGGSGVHHKASSFDADVTPAGLENINYKSDNTTTDAVKQIAAQFTSYIQQLSSVGVDPTGDKITTQLSPEKNRFILNGQSFNFDPSDTNSVNTAFSDLFKQILATAKITNEDLAKALEKVNTEGKSFAEVIAEINFEENTLPQLIKQAQTQVYNTQLQQAQSQIQLLQQQATAYQTARDKWQGYADSLQTAINNLLIDANLSPLSPEQRLEQARSQFNDVAAQAQSGNETAISQLQSSGQALLTASKDYYASSEGYFQDFDLVKNTLNQTSNYAENQVGIQNAMLVNAQAQLAEEQKQSDYLQQMITKLSAGTQSGPWSQIPDSELLRPGENPTDLNSINPNNKLPERLVRELKVLSGFDFTSAANLGISFAQAVQAGKADGNFFNQLIQQVGGVTQAFASGGMASPGLALVGERGPELVRFGSSARVYNAGDTSKILSGANDNGVISEIRALRQDFASLIRIVAASGDTNNDGLQAIEDRLAGIESKARLQAAA